MNTAIINFFHSLQKDDEGHFIIGRIHETIAIAISAKTSLIVMSEVSLHKNLDHHQDLQLADYQYLPHIIIDHHIVLKDGDKTIGVVHIAEELYYFALKSTESGETIFLTSFRKTSDSDLKRLKKKVEKRKATILFGTFDPDGEGLSSPSKTRS